MQSPICLKWNVGWNHFLLSGLLKTFIFFCIFRFLVRATAMMNILTVTDRRGLPGSWISFQLTVKCLHMDSAMRRVKIIPSMLERRTWNIYLTDWCYFSKQIRRFLKENLGLMKRMTSDLDSREVVREMRSGFNHWTDPESFMSSVAAGLSQASDPWWVVSSGRWCHTYYWYDH